ncbi:peroxiredoxin-like family protein [Kangiella sediminilitoris]|uniref:thioredoxin-dependent peroxiredoxin n=1 Tax=Kangiella sediminilitoris TaxID=1144748 RepID=A0A1B3BC71_9GAMM|nr:peroxiredoxin-like family protein [Kangiella sediminilitoris]AOE50409.1 Alkyl hydroperoxide reductase/ Thiol specific antioxidant/ Mal allergen [Kangiella sediminilitoris]
MKLFSKLCLMLVMLVSAKLVSAIDRTQVVDDPNDVSPLLIGQAAPDIMLFDSEGAPFSLLEKISKQPTIIVFYRGGWCPFCNAQLSQLQDIQDELKDLGYQLLAISPDTPSELNKTSKDRELDYQLISDFQLKATRQFGLAFHIPNDYRDKVESIGGKTVRLAGDDKSTLPVPAVFVFDKDGIIQFQYANPNYKVRIEPELLLTAAKLALEKQ